MAKVATFTAAAAIVFAAVFPAIYTFVSFA